MVLTLRNCPPFTPVNSHADAQKSSGAFFRGWCGERCRKRLSGRRNALRASQAVQTTDVMVNRNFCFDLLSMCLFDDCSNFYAVIFSKKGVLCLVMFF